MCGGGGLPGVLLPSNAIPSGALGCGVFFFDGDKRLAMKGAFPQTRPWIGACLLIEDFKAKGPRIRGSELDCVACIWGFRVVVQSQVPMSIWFSFSCLMLFFD